MGQGIPYETRPEAEKSQKAEGWFKVKPKVTAVWARKLDSPEGVRTGEGEMIWGYSGDYKIVEYSGTYYLTSKQFQDRFEAEG